MSLLDRLRRLIAGRKQPAPQPPVIITYPAGDAPAELLAACNATRASHGLPPFQFDPRLAEAAQAGADHCSIYHTADHWNYAGRLAAAGYAGRATAENAAGTVSAGQAVEMWLLASPAHRANLLGPYRYAGCGVSRITEFTAYVLTVGG